MEANEKAVHHGEEMIRLIMGIGKKMKELARMQAAQYGINLSELETILFLAHSPHDTARDLAQSKGFSRSLVSKTVDSLLKNGFVTARQDTEDRRVIHLELLPKAGEIVKDMEAMREALKREFLAGVTDNEMMEMLRIFHKIQKNMQRIVTEESEENE